MKCIAEPAAACHVAVCSILLVALALLTDVAAASVLDRVNERKLVRIGSGNDTPPMNFIDEGGRWTGFDIDLGEALAERLGVRLERVLVNNTTRVTMLANGQIDLTLSNLSQTRSREEQIDYATPPYLWTAKIFYAPRGKFATVAELGGKRIGVNQGSNAYTAAPEEIARHSSEPPQLVSFQRNAEGLMALRQGKIDAFCQDSPIIAALAADDSDSFEAVGAGFSPGLYGIGVPPNDSRWRDAVSFALQDLLADGTYERIYLEWFGPQGKYPLALDARPRLPRESFGDALYVWPQ
jgi:polar amino acid transport system substrate-binding protein